MKLSLNIVLNSSAQLFSRLFSSFSLLIITYLITQNLSREVWGDFVTITTFVALFALVADFGLNGVVVRKAVIDQDKAAKYFEELLGLRIVLGIISIFLALTVLSLLPHSGAVKIGVVVGVFLILTQAVFNTAAVAFQAKLRYEQFAFSEVVGSLTTLMLVFLAIYLRTGLYGIILVFVIGSLLKAILGLFLAQRLLLGAKVGIGLSLEQWKGFLIAALPLGLVMILNQINANIDKQIIALSDYQAIGGISAAVAVGIYGLAYRVFDFAISLPTFIVNTLYPSMLSSHKDNKVMFGQQTKKLVLVLFGIGIFCSLVAWFLAPFIVGFFGDYLEAISTLRVLLLGLPVFFVTSLLLWTVVTLNKEVFLTFIYGFAVLANIVLNLIFIPMFGYTAAAWVTVVTEIVILVGLFILVNSDINLLSLKNKNA